MIILDAVEEFITTFRRELSTDSGGGNSLMDHLFAILLRLMQSNQSTSLYCCLYPTLCAFVHKFSKLLFYSPTPYGMRIYECLTFIACLSLPISPHSW